jgi:hypothetical protein
MEQSAISAGEKQCIKLWMDGGSMNRGVHTAGRGWMHRERSNMTREDARIYKRLNAYDLDDGIGDLLEAMDEELDEESDFDEEDG